MEIIIALLAASVHCFKGILYLWTVKFVKKYIIVPERESFMHKTIIKVFPILAILEFWGMTVVLLELSY